MVREENTLLQYGPGNLYFQSYLKFYLWGNLNSLEYSTTNRVITLNECIVTVQTTPDILDRVLNPIQIRTDTNIESQGGHFRHIMLTMN